MFYEQIGSSEVHSDTLVCGSFVLSPKRLFREVKEKKNKPFGSLCDLSCKEAGVPDGILQGFLQTL